LIQSLLFCTYKGMYDAADRRFMAQDILKGTITNPQTLNRYVYCIDNPIKYVDPTGLAPEIAIDSLYAYLSKVQNVASNQQSEAHSGNYANTPSVNEQSHMIMGFMRYPQYTGFLWSVTAGTIDSNFVQSVQINEPGAYNALAVRNLHFRDRQGILIDLKHLFATLDGQFNTIASMKYASGLAGDFASHISAIQFKLTGVSFNAYEYFMVFTCQDPEDVSSSLFPYADFFADIDAVNIYALSSISENIIDTFKAYYDNRRPINSSLYRFSAFYYNITGLVMPTNINHANVDLKRLESQLEIILSPTPQLGLLNKDYDKNSSKIGAKAFARLIKERADAEKR